jgi:hypothetical protein
MTVTAYWQTQAAGSISLKAGGSTVAVELRLPNTGTFVIWGKVTVLNETSPSANYVVSMTTLDGATTLDITSFGALSMCVPLQSTLDLSQPNVNEIVDIRCAASAAGSVISASLIAIPVDALSHAAAAAPPS